MADQHAHVLGPDRQGHGRARRRRRGAVADREGDAGDRDPAGPFDDPRQQVAGADELGDEGVCRLAVDVERRPELLDAAVVHDHDQVGHGHRLALVVGDQDGGDAETLLQQPQLHLHGLAQLGVEGGQRFVEQEQLGLDGERAGGRHALPLAAGKLADVALGEAGHTYQLEQFGGPPPAGGEVGAADAQGVGDVVLDAEVGKQRQRLEHHAEIAPVRGAVGDVLAVEQDAAGARRLQPGDQAQQRRLAAARRPEEADEAAGRQRQIDVGHRQHAIEALGEALQDQPVHATIRCDRVPPGRRNHASEFPESQIGKSGPGPPASTGSA